MDTHEYGYWVQCTRLRSKRNKKRMQREDEDKQLIRKHKEEVALRKQIWNLGWEELKPPIQRGFIRYFVLREDVARTKEAAFFQKILDKINTRKWSYRKDFKKKVRRFGKKVLKVREQNLKDIFENDFVKKFSDAERSYFYEQLVHGHKKNEILKVFRFSESWRFVLKVQPNMITKVRIKDLDLERRAAEIEKFFNYKRRSRLWKLVDSTYRWHRRPEDHLMNPLHNKSFASILEEHWPEPQMKVTSKNPRQDRGFCFLDYFWITFFMKKITLLCSITFLIIISACVGPEKSKSRIDVANKTFAFEIGIYFDSDSIIKEALIDKATQMLYEFKYREKVPDSIQDNGFSVTRYNDLTQDYQPPDTSFLSFAGIGLSTEENVKLSKSKSAIVLSLWGTKENVIEKQKKIVDLISTVTSGKKLFIGDFSALSFFSPNTWKVSRQERFKGSNIIDQIVLHTYREENFCRVVSLGMTKFCLPDVSIKEISCNDQRTYATLVNTLIATLVENSNINSDSTLTIDLQQIKDAKLREAAFSDIKSRAVKKAIVSLRFVSPEQGDNPNKQLRIVFEDPSFSSPQEQQNKLVSDLFGSEESYKATEHDDELLQASERAKSKLPELMKMFLNGFEPGYSLLLKLPFETDSGGREWMWVEVTKWKGDFIEGILQNEPTEVSNLKVGAIVKGSQQDVFDYILNKPDGTMEGNETGKIIELRN